MNINDIGRKEAPVRISSAPGWLSCEAFALGKSLVTDTGSLAAEAGSAADLAIKLMHQGKTIEEAVEQAISAHPTAERPVVLNVAGKYWDDPVSKRYGTVLPESQDLEVCVEIDEVHFIGHMDQVRELDGSLFVWDLKQSKFSGTQLTFDYIAQLVLYAKAATIWYGKPVGVGGIIRLSEYQKRTPEMAYYPTPIPDAMGDNIVRQITGSIRRARSRKPVAFRPCGRCYYCPLGGMDKCYATLASLVAGQKTCPVCGKVGCRLKSCRTRLASIELGEFEGIVL